MFDELYENIGGKIKNCAKCIFVIGLISSILIGIVVLAALGVEYGWWGLLVILLCPIFSLVGSWILYAFGEMVEDVHAIRSKYYPRAEEIALLESEEKARCEAEERAKCEAEEKAKREAEEIAKRESKEKVKREAEEKERIELEQKEKREAEELLDGLPYMRKPKNFESNSNWENGIKKMTYEKLSARYLNVGNYSDTYRYMCYLELINRKKQ